MAPPGALPENRPAEEARDAALAWLYGRINYEARAPIPYSAEGMKLDRMRELARRLGDPQLRFPSVHVAGTKGKGTTATMIAGALRRSGRRVGLYTSPHLERFEERIAVGGEPISAQTLVELVARVRPIAEAMDREPLGGPTFFDLGTAMAFAAFADAGVDAAVVEVGLGGRLDSTNILDEPAAAVITSISLDHTAQLGPTRGRIAAEKAGVFKPGRPAISGVCDAEAGDVIERIAAERGATLSRLGRDFVIAPQSDGAWEFTPRQQRLGPPVGGVRPPAPGAHQAENAAVALATLAVLAGEGLPTSAQDRLAGVASARLPARMERFDGDPPVVLDGAHNDASAAALADALDALCGAPTERRALVVAISDDKDAAAILARLAPLVGRIVATRFLENPRAIPAERLAEIARRVAPARVSVVPQSTPAEALNDAAAGARSAGGVVVVAGSMFLAAEVRRLLLAQGDADARGYAGG